MTIHEASQQIRFQLFHVYDEREAGNVTELLMEHITGWKRIDRVVNKTVPLSLQQQKMLEQYTAALLRNEPLQYVLHQAWFYDMQLYVDENVLIPRPETEELVDWLVKDNISPKSGIHSQVPVNKTILDIGTGSGCIPLAIKKSLPAFDVHAADISEGALHVARKNAADQKLNIHFYELDILAETSWEALPMFDIIVSNPPYIPESDKESMAANVLQYEPSLALFVENNDPLLFYKIIADFAKKQLKENGRIYLEIHEAMGNDIIDLYKQKGFANIELRKDMQGRDRMVRIV
ncbi:MAG: peptide chain release factor N(5)-glutamine methyltransferase [Chitinophagaceae bacterium]